MEPAAPPKKRTGVLSEQAMPSIYNGDRLRPGLAQRTHALRLLPARAPGAQGPPRLKTFARLSTLSAAAYGLLALWVYCLVPRSMDDPDIWWHLRNAALEWQTHSWLHHDTYSFTAAGAPWINHEWLAEVPFYLGWRMAGRVGLYLVTLAVIEFILLGVYWLTRRQAKDPVSASLLAAGLAALLATVSFGPRMLLFGWACLVIELVLLQRFYQALLKTPEGEGIARQDRTLFALPFLFAFWVNLHGSWMIGLVLLLFFIGSGLLQVETGSIRNPHWTRRQWQTLAPVLLLSLGALFVNPYGWHLVVYPFDIAFYQALNIASVDEWKPLNFQTARGLIFLLSLGTLFFTQVARRLTWNLWELAFAAIGIYAACRHTRFLFLGAILVMPLLGRQLAHCFVRQASAHKASVRRLFRFERRSTRARPWLNAGVLAATLLLAVSAIVGSLRQAPVPVKDPLFPVAALPYLRQFHPQGHLFNEYLWGGYLAYNVPLIPVFIDSRMDIFERNGTLRDYLDIITLNRSLTLLDKYQIRYVFFEKQTPLVYLLQQTHAWKSDYEDSHFILLERVATPAEWETPAKLVSAATPAASR